MGEVAARDRTTPLASSADGPQVGAFLDVDGAVLAGRLTPGGASSRALADVIQPEVRDLIAAHAARGHTVALTAWASPAEVQPLADALGVDHVIGVDLDGDDPGLGRREKVDLVERFAADHGIDLRESHAYGSRAADIPVLAAVGHPHATNPDTVVQEVAGSAGWPVLRFTSRSAPSPMTVARTLAGYGAMIPSMLGGVAVGILRRDRNVIAQHGVNTWIERMFALTGVELRVWGEENLTSHRPAVFIYNHRNNFDPYVAIKLVHDDWGSVGKKEIAGPLAPVMQWLTPNVAFIDRSSAQKAVEGLEPVTELLRRGVSILVAPEGTRSSDGTLGPFKKGPFHMAMQAGVPIVPIVIRNADHLTTRGASVIRSGTIDVAVLPPVPIEGWTAKNLGRRIEGVRKQFLDTLADWPAPLARA